MGNVGYNDVRRRWPQRQREVRFVTIQPDPGLSRRLETLGVRRVLVCERDRATAENVAADVSAVLAAGGFTIAPVVVERAADALAQADPLTAVPFSHRVYGPRLRPSNARVRTHSRRDT